MREGEYYLCEACGEPAEFKRLDPLPWPTFVCSTCLYSDLRPD